MRSSSFPISVFLLGAAVTVAGGACDALRSPGVAQGSAGTGGANNTGGQAGRGASDLAPRQRVLDEVGRCALALYTDFVRVATGLSQALAAYAESGAEPERHAAQKAWHDALAVWEEAELFQVGPAGLSGAVLGGRDLRDQIYSWPLVNPCAVDQWIVSKAYERPDFHDSLINARGLGAIEYLIFGLGTQSSCDPSNLILQNGSWAALAPEELSLRRRTYAKIAGQGVAARAQELLSAWAPEAEDFLGQLVSAGRGSSVYRQEQAGLNAISDALFYIEKETKDLKLGKVIGLGECQTPTCPEAAESRFAGADKLHLTHNLSGFRKAFSGCGPTGEGFSFEDLLRLLGAEELATQLLARLAATQAAIEALPGQGLAQTVLEDPARVREVYTTLKTLTDLVKTQFITVLDLELPKRTEGDND